MARTLQSRAPAPPGAANGPGALAEAPLGGTRSEAIRRFQMGAIGVAAVLILIALASLIKDRATQTDSTAVAGAAATVAPSASAAAADPLAEAGVVPEMPGSPPDGIATAAAPPPPATTRRAGAAPTDAR